MAMSRARILSSENDSSVTNKQEQTTNVNIKVQKAEPTNFTPAAGIPLVDPATTSTMSAVYPSVAPMYNAPEEGEVKTVPLNESPSAYTTQSLSNSSVGQLRNEQLEKLKQSVESLTKDKEFYKLLLQVYQDNPLIVNAYVVCKSNVLMDLIKLLTDCDKVDLVLDDDITCGGCGGNSKLIYVNKILVTKADRTAELKYEYNEAYSKLVVYGISTKIVGT